MLQTPMPESSIDRTSVQHHLLPFRDPLLLGLRGGECSPELQRLKGLQAPVALKRRKSLGMLFLLYTIWEALHDTRGPQQEGRS